MILSVKSFSQKVGIFDGQSDVGKVLHAGKAVYNSTTGDYSVSGSGANIWFANDQFHFVWKKMKGDFNFCHSELVAHGFPVRFCNRTNPDEKASISVRGSHLGLRLSLRYEWYAMQRYASDYFQEFEKPKIMYQKFQVKPCFIYDVEGLFCNDSMWLIPSEDKVLLGILNSKMGWWLISKYCTAIQNGYQLIWKYFSQIPIATGNNVVREKIGDLVNKILFIKKQNSQADTTALESTIDQLVYKLYDLTEEEITIIEDNTK